jgi:hypothetical protein
MLDYNWILLVFTLGSNISSPEHVGVYATQAECREAASRATFASAGNENVRAVTWCGVEPAAPISVVRPPHTVGGP